ncbi:hypothetical protein O181_043219 [Austropuccinia psidii MF-1]|uniref:Uncharacterized protein n=1 Tax=Austropuccinia psidii MF-1 TaxID=1389203 RepID=A0A9Q3DHV9_9BASI|nr:hypothetical protein [Austropuccinia psidii MF-1]
MPPSTLLTPDPLFPLPFLGSFSALQHSFDASPQSLPHQSLRFRTPAAYNPYAPAAPSRYASKASLNPPYA